MIGRRLGKIGCTNTIWGAGEPTKYGFGDLEIKQHEMLLQVKKNGHHYYYFLLAFGVGLQSITLSLSQNLKITNGVAWRNCSPVKV